MRSARGDANRVARPYLETCVAKDHASATGNNMVQLFAQPMAVQGGCLAGCHRGFGEALVVHRMPGRMHQFTYFRSVPGRKGFDLIR